MTRQMKSGFDSDIAIPPGETLQEYLESLSMTQADLAKRVGLSSKSINEIIKGKAAISPEIAIKLESVLTIPARFWNKLEANFQENRARLQAEAAIEAEVEMVKSFPYGELVKEGFVKPAREEEEKVSNLRQFFGAASLEFIPDLWPAVFRKPDMDISAHYALASWLRMGELLAADIETQSFDKKKLKEKIPIFRSLTMQDAEDFIPCLEDVCVSCGIALLMLPHLPKTHAGGAVKWVNTDKVMLQLSSKYNYADLFWFSFFHELGHIFLHSKKELFVEPGDTAKLENEADRFARDCLIPASKYKAFLSKNQFTADAIKQFAGEIGIDEGIVAGSLHHEGKIKAKAFQDLRREFK